MRTNTNNTQRIKTLVELVNGNYSTAYDMLLAGRITACRNKDEAARDDFTALIREVLEQWSKHNTDVNTKIEHTQENNT